MSQKDELSDNELDFETFGDRMEGEIDSPKTHDNQCTVCRKRLKNPRVLNCLHIVCESCLQPKHSSNSISLQCAECDRITYLDSNNDSNCSNETGIKLLLPAYVAANLLDMEEVREGCVLCTSCKSAIRAVARCADCAHFLCPNCNTAHEVMRCFENHRVLSLDELQKAAKLDDPIPVHRPVMCLRHPVECVKFFCITCQEVACSECIADHQMVDHVYERAPDADAAMRAELRLLTRESQNRVCLEDDSNTLLATLNDLQTSHDQTKTLIDKTYEEYKAILDRKRDDTLAELKSLQKSRELAVMEQLKQLSVERPHFQHAVEFAQRLLNLADAAEMLASKRTVTHRLREIIDRPVMQPPSAVILFVSDKELFNKSVQEAFGKVRFSDELAEESAKFDSRSCSPHDNHLGNHLNQSNLVKTMSTGITSHNNHPQPLNLFSSSISIATSGIVSSGGGSPTSLRSSDSEHYMTAINASFGLRNATIGGSSISGLEVVTSPPPPPPSSIASPDTPSILCEKSAVTIIEEYNLQRLATLSSENSGAEAPFDNSASPNAPFFFQGDMLSAGGANDHTLSNIQALAKLSDVNSGINGHVSTNNSSVIDGLPLALNNLHSFNSLSGLNGYNESQFPLLPNLNSLQEVAGLVNAALNNNSGLIGPSVNGVSGSTIGATSLSSGTLCNNNPPPMSIMRTLSNGHNFPPPRLPNTSTPCMSVQCKFGQLGTSPGQLNSPHGFCLGNDGEIIVADTNNHRIQVFGKSGEFKFQFGAMGKEEGHLYFPRKVAVIKTGKFVVCDRGNERSRMQIFNKTGHFLRKIGIRYIDIVAGLAVTQSGNIVAVDSVSPTVFVISELGDLLQWFDTADHMREPSDIAVHDNLFYICDFKGHCVVVFNQYGHFLSRIGCEGVTNFPNGIDVSDDGKILVGDSHGNRFHVVVFEKNGTMVNDVECPYVKVSRCCGLKITAEGNIVTLAKNNHHVLVLGTLAISDNMTLNNF